jgi:hypothetical protein
MTNGIRAFFLAAAMLAPVSQAAAEEFSCDYIWINGKKSGLGKDAKLDIRDGKARWFFQVFKDVSQPKQGMRDEVFEYQVVENNETGLIAVHPVTNAAAGIAGVEALVLNKTDGLLRLGQVNSDDVAANLVARCDRG